MPCALHSRDASLFENRAVHAAPATPSGAQRAYAPRGACADSAHQLDEASENAPSGRNHRRSTPGRDRTGCRYSPMPRSHGTCTADNSVRAPHSTNQWTNPCRARITATRILLARHRTEGPGADREIFTRAFTSIRVAHKNNEQSQPTRAPAARSASTSQHWKSRCPYRGSLERSRNPRRTHPRKQDRTHSGKRLSSSPRATYAACGTCRLTRLQTV